MPPKTPNFVFIVLDTHRVDRLGCYGHAKNTSPNIDAFARESTVFENAISPAQWTIPSHASMFSGEFPSTHMTVQSGNELSPKYITLAERLQARGYHTAGFCNNPLVGVLKNGLTRGFKTFYNYGGAIPTVPDRGNGKRFAPFRKFWESYTQLLRKISYPIQNLVARSTRVLEFTLNPMFVPLWTRYAHFKGETRASIQDTTAYLKKNLSPKDGEPFFLFLNLMETHLPYTPPETFTREFAPIIEDPEAWGFMRFYNTQARRWLLPMENYFSDLEYQTLCSMYDAEVAYQDHLLAQFLAELDSPYHRENTIVIMVADHGEMLGEHRIMGHGLGVYQELVHVPLILRFPGQAAGNRVKAPVSTTYLFHTVLEAAGIDMIETTYSPEVDIKSLSLFPLAEGTEIPATSVFSEAFAPNNVLQIMNKHEPALLESRHVKATNRAFYSTPYKMIRIEGVRDELYCPEHDPREVHNLLSKTDPALIQKMVEELNAFLERSLARRPDGWAQGKVNLDDEKLAQRMRGLGYIE